MYSKSKNSSRKILLHLFLVLVAASVLLPFAYIVVTAFGKDVFSAGGVLPRSFTLDNFVKLFTEFTFLRWLWNSIYLSLGAMAVSVVLTSISVYAFSRLRLRGGEQLFSAILLVQVFPLTLSMVSIHKILSTFELLDKIEGLIIVDSVMASAGLVLLAKGFFDTIPYSLDEAAQIDGAGKFTIFYRIILPLSKPMLAIVAVQSFVLAYNEYVIASVAMTGGFKSMPLAVGLQSMLEGQYAINWPLYCAGAIVGSIPMIIIFYSLQKYSITGLTDGGVKQ